MTHTIPQPGLPEQEPVSVLLNTGSLPWLLAASITVLALAGSVVMVLHDVYGYNYAKGLIPMFDLGGEGNVPTLFSFLLIAANAALLGCIAADARRRDDAMALRWKLLAIIFVFLAVDEMVGLHELSGKPLRILLDASGAFTYAWVVLAIPLLVLLGLYYLRFVLALPTTTRDLVVFAGFIYVGGALGMEMIGGLYSPEYGTRTLTYGICEVIEETLEMAGMAVFLLTLKHYASRHVSEVRLILH